ncbi:MAG: inositol monophosphatase family protein [Chryseolinea sp.]
MSINLTDIKSNVISVCGEVAEFIYKEGSSFDRSRIEQKSGFNNLVSYVDQEAERRLVKALGDLLPIAGFITEEGTVTQSKTNEYNWIIDPLDGTTNFLHALPIYSISVGLTRNNKPVLGVVYHVVSKECFHTIEGDNAYCNDRVIHVSTIPVLQESLLATGFPYNRFGKSDDYLSIIKDFLDRTHGIRRLGSAAIDLAYVACGRLEGYFEYNLNAWDVAAGILLVQQAGGKVTDFKGGDNCLFGGELVAANSLIHDEMLNLVQAKWK